MKNNQGIQQIMGSLALCSSIIIDANLLKDVNSVKATWRDYFQDLYNVQNPVDETSVEDLDPAPCDELPTLVILAEEVEAVLGKMKMGKAPGVDSLSAKELKAATEAATVCQNFVGNFQCLLENCNFIPCLLFQPMMPLRPRLTD